MRACERACVGRRGACGLTCMRLRATRALLSAKGGWRGVWKCLKALKSEGLCSQRLEGQRGDGTFGRGNGVTKT